MVKNNTISIIIPVYKVEKFLRDCMESVLSQTYENLEIILVDDGSPDSCPEICDEYAKMDERIKVIHKKNGGLSDARNAGLDIAKGAYIGFVDSDDIVTPDMFSELAEAMIKNDADLSVCGFYYINEQGYRLEKEKEIFTQEKALLTGEECLKHIYFEKNGWKLVPVWNKLYKKEIWETIRFDKGKIHEDEFVFHKIMRQCKKVAILDKPMYGYRKNSNGIMANLNIKSFKDKTEAFLGRGFDTIDLLNGKWHGLNLGGIYGGYKRAKSLASTKEDRDFCENIKKSIKDYIKILVISGKFTGFKGLRRYIEVYEPVFYRAVRKMILILKRQKEWKRIENSVKNSDALLLNVPTHGNLGDHAITVAQIEFLKSVKKDISIYELTGSSFKKHKKRLIKEAGQDKLILIHGGGNIGSLWPNEELTIRNIVKSFPSNRVIIFPQTVTFDMASQEGIRFFEESKNVYSSHKSLTLFVREEKSLEFMKKNMPDVDCLMVPDIVLSYNPDIEKGTREGVLLCLRSDIEKALSEENIHDILECLSNKYANDKIVFTDTVVEHDVKIDERQLVLDNKFRQFSEAELIVTDRLHGMIFAFVTKTPCIALGNINGKVKGVFKWIADCPYMRYVDNIEDFHDVFSEFENIAEDNEEYNFSKDEFSPLYEKLKKEVK